MDGTAQLLDHAERRIEAGSGAVCRLLAGDCLKRMAMLPAGSIDAVVTSPPYNLGIDYGDTYDDRKPRDIYLAWMGEVFEALERVLAADGSLFVIVGGSLKDPLVPFQVLNEATRKFQLQNSIAWVKSITVGERSTGHFKPIPGPRFLNSCFEHVFHLTKTGAAPLDRLAIGVPFADQSNVTRWKHGKSKRCRGNVWYVPYDTVNDRAKRGDHPATYPLALAGMCLDLVGASTATHRKTVLDPFSGTGTTAAAALQRAWDAVGIEINPAWHDYAEQRVRKLGLMWSPEGL